MIRREQDDGIVQLPAFFEVIDNTADAHVEVLDHARKNLLRARVATLFVGAKVCPGLG